MRTADLNDIPNLTGADLVGANLSGNDLRTANFTKADLGSANLSSTWVTGTNFSKAILTSANLASISACSVSWVSSHYEGSGYGFYTLVYVQSMDNGTMKYFDGSIDCIQGWSTCGCSQAAPIPGTPIPTTWSCGVIFTGANLDGATISGLVLGANLSKTTLRGATVSGNVSGSSFYQANLTNAHFTALLYSGTMFQSVVTGINFGYGSNLVCTTKSDGSYAYSANPGPCPGP